MGPAREPLGRLGPMAPSPTREYRPRVRFLPRFPFLAGTRRCVSAVTVAVTSSYSALWCAASAAVIFPSGSLAFPQWVQATGLVAVIFHSGPLSLLQWVRAPVMCCAGRCVVFSSGWARCNAGCSLPCTRTAAYPIPRLQQRISPSTGVA